MGRQLGEALAQSFISSWVRLPVLSISLCTAPRDLLLSWCFHLSLLHPSVLYSLQRMDEGERAARQLSASITSALTGVIGEEFCE